MFWRRLKNRGQDLERELRSHLDIEAEEDGGAMNVIGRTNFRCRAV